MRSYFLSGQLNVAVCPNCQTPVMLEVPLVYHDPQAEFLAIYFPQQLNIPELEKQKMIGELTQSLMRSLPPEQRKGYFLNPRQFVSRQSLADAVYGTMGISQEELDRQRKKAKLVEQFQVFADDPKGLPDDGQARTSSDSTASSSPSWPACSSRPAQPATRRAQGRLEMLRENLMPITTWGKKAQKQRAAVESLKDLKTPEEFLDRMVAADEDEVGCDRAGRPPRARLRLLRGALTRRVDAAAGRGERAAGRSCASSLLDLTKQSGRGRPRASVEDSVELLQEIINSQSPRSAVREHMRRDRRHVHDRADPQHAGCGSRRAIRRCFSGCAMVYDEIMDLMQAERAARSAVHQRAGDGAVPGRHPPAAAGQPRAS